MPSGDDRERVTRDEAERLLDVYLGQVEEGSLFADFNAFCRLHPGHEEELRRLFEEWREFENVADDVRAQFGESPQDLETSSARSILERLRQKRSPEEFVAKGEIGRGGMGVVFRVWDEDFKRDLAMKVLRRRPHTGHDEERLLARFLTEARITGQLEHPGVVPVHQLGADASGNVYFTMNLVRGENLSRVFEFVRNKEKGWNRTRAVGVLLKVCETLAYAHSKNIIHRDLKPSNIMVGRFGEVYVMDWGLAKILDPNDSSEPEEEIKDEDPRRTAVIRPLGSRDESDEQNSPWMTRDGVVLGTPSYMAPEQASGKIRELGPRSDVYAVGAMLYELLASHPPYAEEGSSSNHEQIVRRILEGPPRPLGLDDREGPAELLAIVEKAMARDPGARYASIQDMANDLRAFLENRVVAAYKTGALAELRKWVSRNQTFATVVSFAVVMVIISLTALWIIEARRTEELDFKTKALARSHLETEAALRRASDEANALEKTVEMMETMFSIARPDIAKGDTFSARALIDVAATKLENATDLDPASRSRLNKCVGTLYLGLGEARRSEEFFGRAIEAMDEVENADGPANAKLLLLLCDTLRLQHRFEDARRALDRCEDAMASSPPDESLELLYLSSRAAIEVDEGRLESAEPLLVDAIERSRRRSRQSDDQDTEALLTTLLNNLGVVYEKSSRPDEALIIFEEVLERRMKSSGEKDPQSLIAMANLAKTRFALGQMEAALSLADKTWRLRTVVLGPFHPQTLSSLVQYAVVLMTEGHHADAVDILERAHRDSLQDDISPSFELGRMRTTLAQAYNHCGRSRDALPILEREIEILRQNGGEGSLPLAETLNLFGRTYQTLGIHDKALPPLEECLRIHRQSSSPRPEPFLDVLSSLTRLYLKLDKSKKAMLVANEAYERSLEDLPESNPFLIRATLTLGLVLMDEQPEEAQAYIEEGFDLARTHLPAGHGIRTLATYRLATLMDMLGKKEEASRLAREGLAEARENDALRPALTELID